MCSLSPQGRWREASAVTSWRMRGPGWELGLVRRVPAGAGFCGGGGQWLSSRGSSLRVWEAAVPVLAAGLSWVCAARSVMRPPLETEQKAGLRSHREERPPATAGGTVARAPGAAGSSGRCAPDTDCFVVRAGCCFSLTSAHEAHVDQKNKVVTTPAFMCETALHHIHDGIGAMVTKVLELARK